MKQKNDQIMLNFMIGIFSLAVVNLLWAIIKTIQANWFIFNANGIDIIIAYGVSVYLFWISLNELIYFKKHKNVNHGADERNIRVFDKSLRNVSLVIFIIIKECMIICNVK